MYVCAMSRLWTRLWPILSGRAWGRAQRRARGHGECTENVELLTKPKFHMGRRCGLCRTEAHMGMHTTRRTRVQVRSDWALLVPTSITSVIRGGAAPPPVSPAPGLSEVPPLASCRGSSVQTARPPSASRAPAALPLHVGQGGEDGTANARGVASA